MIRQLGNCINATINTDGGITTQSVYSLVLKENLEEIKDLVSRILRAKRNNSSADTSALESEIDRLVYQLYGLTEEEIKIVEQF